MYQLQNGQHCYSMVYWWRNKHWFMIFSSTIFITPGNVLMYCQVCNKHCLTRRVITIRLNITKADNTLHHVAEHLMSLRCEVVQWFLQAGDCNTYHIIIWLSPSICKTHVCELIIRHEKMHLCVVNSAFYRLYAYIDMGNVFRVISVHSYK